jgi:hypothetical protein
MTFKGATILISPQYEFLQWDGRTWGTTDGQVLILSSANAIRMGWKIVDPLKHLPKGEPALYLVADYGYESEAWQAMYPDGSLKGCEPINPPVGVTVV